MSRERELLKEFIDFVDGYEFYPTERNIIWEIVNRTQELLAQPEQAEIAPSSTKLQDRIKDYLSMGGLFNPELVNHDIVRDLILDARAELLTQKREPLSDGATADMYHANKKATHPDSYWSGVYDAEKAHGITGVDDE